jgi:endonuclease YncB( thermonuclease family)
MSVIRFSRWFRLRGTMRTAALGAALGLAVGVLILFAPEPEAASPREFRVIDGDTLADRRTDERIRLANIDTPETGDRARCPAERRLAAQATDAARELIANARRIVVRPVGRTDQYGRTIAYVRINGRDFGRTMIERGLARPWRGRRQPWCARNGELLHRQSELT